jgi:PKHD-type hydroxylase
MIYNTIVNNPKERRKTFPYYVYWNDAFSNCELNDFENICDTYDRERASTVGEKDKEDCEKVRKSEVCFIDRNNKTSWIFDRFNQVITNMNNEFYQFILNGYDKFQYTVYNSENQGKYDWHMDTIMGPMPDDSFDEIRKLTCVMLLKEPVKDFSGGEFELNISNEEYPMVPEMTRGTIIAFPSFLLHRVKPVYLGVRKSVVIWVEGPKFR